jgi:hypothetical protein
MMYLLINTKEEGTPPEVIAICKTKDEMKKITDALSKANATYSGGLYVVTYDGE